MRDHAEAVLQIFHPEDGTPVPPGVVEGAGCVEFEVDRRVVKELGVPVAARFYIPALPIAVDGPREDFKRTQARWWEFDLRAEQKVAKGFLLTDPVCKGERAHPGCGQHRKTKQEQATALDAPVVSGQQ